MYYHIEDFENDPNWRPSLGKNSTKFISEMTIIMQYVIQILAFVKSIMMKSIHTNHPVPL